MTPNKKVCIIGAGGFGREALCCLIDCFPEIAPRIGDFVVFMDDNERYIKGEKIMEVSIIKRQDFLPEDYDVFIAVGEPTVRKKIAESLPQNTTYITIIHPRAVLSAYVTIGKGSIVTAGTILTCNINIGNHAHLNLNTTIGHDCLIGDYFTTAPAANISGECVFGECVYFGTSTAVRQGINICDNVTIGMGGIVVKNIAEAGVYVGSPVKKMGS